MIFGSIKYYNICKEKQDNVTSKWGSWYIDKDVIRRKYENNSKCVKGSGKKRKLVVTDKNIKQKNKANLKN